jgi:hypothetical protein
MYRRKNLHFIEQIIEEKLKMVFQRATSFSFSTRTKWLFAHWSAKSICLNFGLGSNKHS